jgi:tetratricopeptide (TPR) repeat protein
VETVVASPAAQLFLERAREANPAFFLTRHNAAVVAAICWRLDGLPLALELAAARTRFLGATELLNHLDQALKAVGARDLPERQRTLQATLDWSHDLLSAPEQAVFRRLSVFAGGFTLPAAQAVGATTDVLDVTGSLVDQSLVTVRTTPEGDRYRYALLEPVRAYALEQLTSSGEEDEVRARHARFFAVLAVRAGPELERAEQASWMEDLAAEHDNLRAALRQLLDLREPERVAEIGWQIHRFWSLRGHTAEGRAWMERVLAAPGALSDRARARALYVVGMLSFVRGELDRAGAAAQEAAAAARAADDAEVLASASMGIGLALLSRGDRVAAEGFLSSALSMSRELQNASVTALTLGGLARIALSDAEPIRAAELLAEAEAVSRTVGDAFTLAATLGSQALAARLRGDDLRAGVLLRQSVQCSAGLRDAWHLVLSLSGLAGVAARQGLPHRATRLLGAVEGLSARMGVDVPWSTWQQLDRFDTQRLREQLGAEAFDQARSRGRALLLEEAVSEALADG